MNYKIPTLIASAGLIVGCGLNNDIETSQHVNQDFVTYHDQNFLLRETVTGAQVKYDLQAIMNENRQVDAYAIGILNNNGILDVVSRVDVLSREESEPVLHVTDAIENPNRPVIPFNDSYMCNLLAVIERDQGRSKQLTFENIMEAPQ